MTGQFTAGELTRDPHVHVVLRLTGRKVVTLRDVRKFGKIEWIAPGKSSQRLEKLGPDALLAQTPHLRARFSARSIPIKTALLDQGIWAGVGNIYADEGLYRAKISPTKNANRLKIREVDSLREEIQSLLLQAIEAGGSTINDYIKPDGELGGFQDFHRVYGKKDCPCPGCGTAIVRIVLGGRSTHYCPSCQK
jgi:formamidopyrimidine-DNA glycosylase